jgi:hypothetical protein
MLDEVLHEAQQASRQTSVTMACGYSRRGSTCAWLTACCNTAGGTPALKE